MARQCHSKNIQKFSTKDCHTETEIINNTQCHERDNFIFTILHQNIQSLLNKINEIEVFLDTYDETIQVIALTEHWLGVNDTLVTKVDGYELASCFCRTSKLHGGSCIFVSDGISFREMTELKQKSIEMVIECSSVELQDYNIIIVNIYRPPSGDINEFFVVLEDILQQATTNRNSKVILSGDFNIDMNNFQNINVKKMQDLTSSFNLTITIHEPTRITEHSQTRIDNIFTNIVSYSSTNVITALSDHLAQKLRFEIESSDADEVCRRIYIEKRIITDDKLIEISEYLNNADWSNTINAYNANVAYNNFTEIIMRKFNEECPKKHMRKRNIKNCKWITDEIKQKAARKRLLYEDVRRGIVNVDIYKTYCKELKLQIENRKKQAYSEFINSSQNKVRATWQLVEQISGKVKRKNFNVKNLSIYESDKSAEEVLDDINKYFVDVCKNMERNLPDSNHITRNPATLFLYPTTTVEVHDIIMNLKDTTSVGYDEIPMKLIKICSRTMATVLTPIINKCLESGVFPDNLKYSTIKLIYKKGDEKDIQNYRPISLLPNISKIFEKVISTRIYKFIDRYNILTDRQNGYVKGRTTAKAIYEVLQDILDGINNDCETVGVFMDLTRAFDSVNYSKLYSKLESVGIRGISLDLIRSYLTNRKQRTASLDEESGRVLFSRWETIERGVPQGSILGPLIFLLYTNEIPQIVNHMTTLYADDSSVIIKSDKVNITQEILNTTKQFDDWYSHNDLKLNISKTEIIQFGYFKKDKITLNYNEQVLSSSDEVKFLGMYLDSQLNWKQHITHLAGNMSKFCYALRVVSGSINVDAALGAYYSYVHSRLRYGIIFWGASVEVGRVFILQKLCLRRIFNLKQRQSCKQVFINNKILTVPSVFVLECALFVRNNYNIFRNQELKHEHNTRGNENKHLLPPQTKKTLVNKSVLTMVTKVYNHLPRDLKSYPNSVFKKELKRLLATEAFYSIQEFLDYRF